MGPLLKVHPFPSTSRRGLSLFPGVKKWESGQGPGTANIPASSTLPLGLLAGDMGLGGHTRKGLLGTLDTLPRRR